MTDAFFAGFRLFQLDRYAEAEREFRRYLAEEPGDAAGHAWLALCLVELEKLPEATDEAQQAIVADPTSDFHYYVLGRVLLERNHLAEARRAFQQAIESAPEEVRNHSGMGLVELRQSRWREALAAADQGLALDPEDATCLNIRSAALTHLGRRSEAAETIQDALASNPEDSYIHANHGWAELHNGRPTAALDHFREALRLDPTNEFARSGIVEAMKARNPIYRVMLGYFLAMQRLSSQSRWIVFIAIFFAPRVLRSLGHAWPQGQWLTEILVQLVLVFCVMTWIASPLFNLVLRFDRLGRHALSREQIRGANLMALFLFPALALWVASWFSPEPYKESLFYCAVSLGVVVLPASVLYSCDSGWPRTTMLVYLLVLSGMAALAIAGWSIRLYFELYQVRLPLLSLVALPGLVLTLPLMFSPIATMLLAMWLTSAKVRS